MHRITTRYLLSAFVLAGVLSGALFGELIGATPAQALTRRDFERSREQAERTREAAVAADASADETLREKLEHERTIRKVTAELPKLKAEATKKNRARKSVSEDIERISKKEKVNRRHVARVLKLREGKRAKVRGRLVSRYRGALLQQALQLGVGGEDIPALYSRVLLARHLMAQDGADAAMYALRRSSLDSEHRTLVEALKASSEKRSTLQAQENRLTADIQAGRVRLVSTRKTRAVAAETLLAQRNEGVRLWRRTYGREGRTSKIARLLRRKGVRIAQAKVVPAVALRPSGVKTATPYYGWPTPGFESVLSRFGPRRHPVTRKRHMHAGIDIAAPEDARVAAAGSGVIVFSGPRGTLGHTVILRHGGSSYTVYGHLSRRAVAKGNRVRRGDTLGYVGSSGVSARPHLHFEVRRGGRSLDPMRYLR